MRSGNSVNCFIITVRWHQILYVLNVQCMVFEIVVYIVACRSCSFPYSTLVITILQIDMKALHIEMLVRCILSSVCLRLSQFTQSSFMQCIWLSVWAYPFLSRWFWEYLYCILSSWWNQKCESLTIFRVRLWHNGVCFMITVFLWNIALNTFFYPRSPRLSTCTKRGGIWADAWVCLHYWVVIWVAG